MLNIQAVNTDQNGFDFIDLKTTSTVAVYNSIWELLDVCSLAEALSALAIGEPLILQFDKDILYFSDGSRGCEEGSIDSLGSVVIKNKESMYFLITKSIGEVNLSDIWWDKMGEAQRKWASEILRFMDV